MMRRLEKFSASIGNGDEESNLEALYQELSGHDFSSELLEVFPHKIAVVELNGVLWSDWGRSERIIESLETIGRLPAFSLSLAATA
jgi:mannose-1-phosphate guanylyltransferase